MTSALAPAASAYNLERNSPLLQPRLAFNKIKYMRGDREALPRTGSATSESSWEDPVFAVPACDAPDVLAPRLQERASSP